MMLRRLLVVALLLVAGRTPACLAAPQSMVAAANPMAVEAGLEVLRRGGSAVDAAIAVQMALGVVAPQASGLGCGGFLLHYDAATGAIAVYDGRETAPAGATPAMFLERSGQPPATQSFAATPVLVADLESRDVRQRDRTIHLDGATTSVREAPATPAAVPIEIVGAADIKAAADVTLAAVLSRRVPAPVSGRFATVAFAAVLPAAATPPSLPPWIANALARIATDGAARGTTASTAASTDGLRLT